jgi:F-type H+-transporting ATPase subunit b
MRTRVRTIGSIILFACSVALSSEGKAAATEQGIFGGSFADALWTVIAFTVLMLVLGKFAWKPVINGLKARESHIQQQIEAAGAARKKAEKLLDDYKQQGLEIVQKATDHAQRLEQELMGKTRQEVLALERKARADIEYARVAASQRLWQEASDMLLNLSGEILGRVITHEDNRRLIYEAINKLGEERTNTNERQ